MAARQAWPRRDPLGGVEPVHPAGQGRGDGVGQGEVHVVAAEQDVLADGQAGQGEVAALVGHGDQGEVGRPAADVADEEEVADLDLLPPAVALRGEPGVEGGLRLLQERDVLQPGGPGGLDGQLAGDGVERGGDGQQDVLVFEPVGGDLPAICVVPGVAEVGQVGGRGLDRRDLRDVVGGAPGQDRALAVDPGVREPALGRADQPARDLRPVVAGERPDDPVGRLASRAGRAPRRGTPSPRAGRGTRAGPAGRRRRSTPTTCGIGNGRIGGRRASPSAAASA